MRFSELVLFIHSLHLHWIQMVMWSTALWKNTQGCEFITRGVTSDPSELSCENVKANNCTLNINLFYSFSLNSVKVQCLTNADKNVSASVFYLIYIYIYIYIYAGWQYCENKINNSSLSVYEEHFWSTSAHYRYIPELIHDRSTL